MFKSRRFYQKKILFQNFFFLLSLHLNSACNFFSALDPPSNDAQYQSRGDALFDSGDFLSAINWYTQVKDQDIIDQAVIDATFADFANLGISGAFLLESVALAAGSTGKLITLIGNQLISPAGEANRIYLFKTYQGYQKLQSVQNRGSVRFLTALVLASELLAEDAVSVGSILKSHLVLDPKSCGDTISQCGSNFLASMALIIPACSAPTNSLFIEGDSNFSLPTASTTSLTGTPSLFILLSSIKEIQAGLNDLQSGSGLANNSSNFSREILEYGSLSITSATENGSPAFRGILIQNGIGD